MSLTLGAFKVHSVLEKVIPTPYSISLETYRISKSVSYNLSIHRLIRTCILYTIVCPLIPFITWRLVWLIHNWKVFTSLHFDQLVAYAALTCGIIIFTTAWHLERTQSETIQFILNERCNLVSITAYLITSPYDMQICIPYVGIYCLKELFIYGFSFPFILANLAAIAAPFAITYDPIQLIIGEQSVLIKFCLGWLYSVYVLYGQTTLLSALLLSIAFLEGIVSYSGTIHYMNEPFSTLMKFRFRHCYRRYRILKILTVYANHVIQVFVTVLIFVGILLASCGAFATLKMYTVLNIFTYIIAPTGTVICFVVAILFTYLANFPYKNSLIFKQYWKRIVTRKEEKRMLLACTRIGFDLGPYGLAKAMLGLHICDDIIRNTVTFLLLGVL